MHDFLENILDAKTKSGLTYSMISFENKLRSRKVLFHKQNKIHDFLFLMLTKAESTNSNTPNYLVGASENQIPSQQKVDQSKTYR